MSGSDRGPWEKGLPSRYLAHGLPVHLRFYLLSRVGVP